MADKKFILSGPETVTLSVQTVNKLIRAGDGDAALLYLYMLKTRDQSTPGEVAQAMGKSTGWVASAMAMLSRLGLIKSDENPSEPLTDAPAEAPVEEPRRYTVDEIRQEIETGSGFAALIDETQNSLGKKLSPDELERLFGIYDNLHLPVEVIMLLITHCIKESRRHGSGRMPPVRYIEKAAFTWEREGINSLDKAEEYLKALEARRSVYGEMKAVLKITDRELSDFEKEYVDKWITMGFGADAVGLAYSITTIKTGNRVWGYMNTIMNNWHEKGLHTQREITEKDGGLYRNTTRKDPKNSKEKFGEPTNEEITRMLEVLEKIKEN